MIVERITGPRPVEVLERVLDKGIVIDAWVRVALVGIDLIRVEARVVVASIETYLQYADTPELGVGAVPGERPVRAEPVEPSAPAARRRPGARKTMSAAEMTRLIRAALQAWNGRDAQRYASLLNEDYVGETHAVPVTLRGRGAARRAMRMKLAIFPDLKFKLQDTLTAGDEALVSWTATGTRNRQRVRVSGCTVARLRDGKVDHTWCYWDTADMLAPLRVVRDGPHTLHRLATTS